MVGSVPPSSMHSITSPVMSARWASSVTVRPRAERMSYRAWPEARASRMPASAARCDTGHVRGWLGHRGDDGPARLDDELAGLGRPLAVADRSCCCAAGPAVTVIMPPAPGRLHPVDLLLCGHHYQAGRAQRGRRYRLRRSRRAGHDRRQRAAPCPPRTRRGGRRLIPPGYARIRSRPAERTSRAPFPRPLSSSDRSTVSMRLPGFGPAPRACRKEAGCAGRSGRRLYRRAHPRWPAMASAAMRCPAPRDRCPGGSPAWFRRRRLGAGANRPIRWLSPSGAAPEVAGRGRDRVRKGADGCGRDMV